MVLCYAVSRPAWFVAAATHNWRKSKVGIPSETPFGVLSPIGVVVLRLISPIWTFCLRDGEKPQTSPSFPLVSSLAVMPPITCSPQKEFPPPWTVEEFPGGLKVCDANGQSLAYVYSRENASDTHMANVLTEDEARRIASNIAKLPILLGKGD